MNSVFCNCGKEARTCVVTQKTPNQGREYYKCAGSPLVCKFFRWKPVRTAEEIEKTRLTRMRDFQYHQHRREMIALEKILADKDHAWSFSPDEVKAATKEGHVRDMKEFQRMMEQRDYEYITLNEEIGE